MAETPIVRAESADAPPLAAALAVSFLDTVPWSWIFPDRGERGRLLPRLLRLYLDDALEHGAVYTTEDRSAAAIWLPRAEQTTPLDNEQARLKEALGARRAGRVRRYHALIDAGRPAEPHDQLWASAPPDGQRIGGLSRLLGEHQRTLDENGRTAYLQAPDSRTRDRYLVQGYRSPPVAEIVLPAPGGRVLYPMWRPSSRRPRSAGPCACAPISPLLDVGPPSV